MQRSKKILLGTALMFLLLTVTRRAFALGSRQSISMKEALKASGFEEALKGFVSVAWIVSPQPPDNNVKTIKFFLTTIKQSWRRNKLCT